MGAGVIQVGSTACYTCGLYMWAVQMGAGIQLRLAVHQSTWAVHVSGAVGFSSAGMWAHVINALFPPSLVCVSTHSILCRA